MVDSVLAPQAQTVSGAGKAERVKARDPAGVARPSAGASQRAFGAGFSQSVTVLPTASNDQAPAGGGLLSTGVQILLAETRSEEASAPFVPSSKLDNAINTYVETQGQVRETIRANGGGFGNLAGPAPAPAAAQPNTETNTPNLANTITSV